MGLILLPNGPDEISQAIRVYGETWGAHGHGAREPWRGQIPMPGTWRLDPVLGSFDVLRKVPTDLLQSTESVGHCRARDDYKTYVEWAAQGLRPPPPSVLWKEEDGGLWSVNRRRVLAAQEAGVRSMACWVTPVFKDNAWPWMLPKRHFCEMERGAVCWGHSGRQYEAVNAATAFEHWGACDCTALDASCQGELVHLCPWEWVHYQRPDPWARNGGW